MNFDGSGTLFVIARLEDKSCDFIRLSSQLSSRKYSTFDEMIMIESERMIENLVGSANFRM